MEKTPKSGVWLRCCSCPCWIKPENQVLVEWKNQKPISCICKCCYEKQLKQQPIDFKSKNKYLEGGKN